uniref:Uncharacterized protein n=1 Tax=Trichobilharzia regenti TaxID=157069 RepID=A0AA85J552_TRIRE|nr:unnamed protein product [Trichobilharzia regenti]
MVYIRMRKVSYPEKMVYSAYSHITVITLLAFAAINGEQGEQEDDTLSMESLADAENKTLEIIPHLESAEDATRGMKELLHRLNPNSRVELDNHIDCLEAAHTYNWGVIVFDSLVKRLLRYRDVNLADVVNCCKEEASAYREKVKEFPLKNCFENLPSASRQSINLLFIYIHVEINNIFTYIYDDGIFSSITIPSS